MILLVETNFVLELAFLQEDHGRCRAMLELARELPEELQLAFPASSVVEAYNKQIGRQQQRLHSQRLAISELEQLARSEPYAERSGELRRDVTELLIASGEEERQRLEDVLAELYAAATVIPLDAGVVQESQRLQRERGLSPPDALVYSSVLSHLNAAALSSRRYEVPHCFVTRDRDFTDDDLRSDLEGLGCKIMFKFEDGLGYVRSRLSS